MLGPTLIKDDIISNISLLGKMPFENASLHLPRCNTSVISLSETRFQGSALLPAISFLKDRRRMVCRSLSLKANSVVSFIYIASTPLTTMSCMLPRVPRSFVYTIHRQGLMLSSGGSVVLKQATFSKLASLGRNKQHPGLVEESSLGFRCRPLF